MAENNSSDCVTSYESPQHISKPISHNLAFIQIAIALTFITMILQCQINIGILNLQWGEPLLLLTLGIGLLKALHFRTVCRTSADASILLYIVSIVSALLVGGLTEHALGIFRKELLSILFFYVIMWNAGSGNGRRVIAVGILISATIAGMIALIQHLSPQSIQTFFPPTDDTNGIYPRGLVGFLLTGSPSQVRPVYAPFGHFNMLGSFLAITFPLLISAVLFNRRFYLILMVSTTGLALYLTYSRGAWSGFVVAIVILGWLYLKRSKRKGLSIIFGISGVAVLVLFLVVLFATGYDKTLHLANSREILWELIIKKVSKSPFLGLGLGGVEEYLGTHAFNRSAHSDYFQVLGDRGIFGLICYLQLLFFGVISGFRKALYGVQPRWIYIGVTAGLSAYMIHALVDHPMNGLTFKLLIFAYLALLASSPED